MAKTDLPQVSDAAKPLSPGIPEQQLQAWPAFRELLPEFFVYFRHEREPFAYIK